ncbi:RNA polymerase sigma factor [Streptomyces sudanensis]|uniref:RNA polymerase sigma factor n=2 Tax=Streptomyces sudanensis TaxID=436397 RepID=A0ABY4TP59_9ACTN|nr:MULTISPECIES: RNA polymerase sigma factor [Streptomyces]MCP9958558.1 RNA polymerase sigma factor [Streptomyces sudanensis]MCP9987674.1 RNA polymerase sigma factor [Streptomyces sudanensis]MCQ0000934.1 RNA polymerase sigma factor [Streptomyces sudanensis]URN18745.1 RNA polymerase sigma factor [Streptomyces sudanensis]
MDDKAEQQLTELLAADLDGGFTELVRVHGRAVYTFLLRVSGSATEADDLGQDAFLRAYTALQGYAPERRRELKPRAWLLAIAANVWRNHVRTCTRRPALAGMPVEDAAGSWTDLRPGPEERAELADDRGRLVTALLRLPEHQRMAVVLRHVMGMSYAEVAEVQGRAVGTVKAQVSRGLRSLRGLLDSATPVKEEVTT